MAKQLLLIFIFQTITITRLSLIDNILESIGRQLLSIVTTTQDMHHIFRMSAHRKQCHQ